MNDIEQELAEMRHRADMFGTEGFTHPVDIAKDRRKLLGIVDDLRAEAIRCKAEDDRVCERLRVALAENAKLTADFIAYTQAAKVDDEEQSEAWAKMRDQRNGAFAENAKLVAALTSACWTVDFLMRGGTSPEAGGDVFSSSPERSGDAGGSESPGCAPLASGGSWEDRPLPEDEAIAAAHPTRSGRHDLYVEAMRLVGARHSKAGLVELTTWLLIERDNAREALRIETERLTRARDTALNTIAFVLRNYPSNYGASVDAMRATLLDLQARK